MSKENPLGPRLLRLFKNCYLDFRYGRRFLLGSPQNENKMRGWHPSQSSDYSALTVLFSSISVQTDDILVDVGCGYGRVFNWLLYKGFKNKLIGIDVDVKVTASTKKRFRKYSQIEIISGDVTTDLPLGTIYYLFNPFSLLIINNFAAQLEERIVSGVYNQRKQLLILYYNCTCLDRFKNNPYWDVQELGVVSFSKLPAAIIRARIL